MGKRRVREVKEERPFDFSRFKRIREEQLELSYEAFTAESGITRTDVRLIEEGRMVFIPIRYLQFLREKGVDLNELFA